MLLVQQKSVLRTKAMQVIEQRLGEPLEVYLRRRYEDDERTSERWQTLALRQRSLRSPLRCRLRRAEKSLRGSPP